MGCVASSHRRSDSDVVLQCTERYRLIKNAVKGRQDFAIAHAAYIDSLQNVGLALRRLSEGGAADMAPSLLQETSPPLLLSAPSPSPSPSPVLCVLPFSPLPLPPPPSSSASSSSSSVCSSSSSSSPCPQSLALQALPPPPLNLASSPCPSDLKPSSSALAIAPHSSETMDPPVPPYFSPSPSPKRNPTPSANSSSSSSWFIYDIFDAPPIPYNLLEHRKKNEEEEEEEEEAHGFDVLEKAEPSLHGRDGGDKGRETEGGDGYAEQVEEEEEGGGGGGGKEEACAEARSNREGSPEKELAIVSAAEAKELRGAVRHIHGHFARASMSGKDVSCMLETQASSQHYQDMNLLLSCGHDSSSSSSLSSSSSSKAFNAITWHWSRKTSVAVRDAYCHDSTDIPPECGMLGSQASTLDRICAWERKLYEEVKEGELIRELFERKCQQLQRLEAKGTDRSSVDKIRVVVKKLDTQLMVALQTISQASKTIQKLSNEELYPQLVELLGGLMHMWKVMCECHRAQQAIASEMQTVDNIVTRVEGNETYIKAFAELERELSNWRTHFQRWITSQKNYVSALNTWLSKCHTEPEKDKRKGRRAAPSVLEKSTIFVILKHWCNSLEQLEKEQSVVEAIGNFSEVVHYLRAEQVDDGNLKRLECSSIKRQDKKYLEFNEANGDSEVGMDSKRAEANSHDEMRQSQLEYRRKEKILSRFREHLPYVFESMALFARDALRIYESLQQANMMKKVTDSHMLPGRESVS